MAKTEEKGFDPVIVNIYDSDGNHVEGRVVTDQEHLNGILKINSTIEKLEDGTLKIQRK